MVVLQKVNSNRYKGKHLFKLGYYFQKFLVFRKNFDLKTLEEIIGSNIFSCIILTISCYINISMLNHPPNLVHSKYHNIKYKQPLQQDANNPYHFMSENYYFYHRKSCLSSIFKHLKYVFKNVSMK